MQYEAPTTSKLTMRSDWPVGCSATGRGANLNTVGFNLDFIAERDPKLVLELVKLWQQARGLQEDSPHAPDEDYLLADAALKQLVAASER